VITFPNRQVMIIDAGGEAFLPIDVWKRVLIPYFRQQRIKKLDIAVLSHPHPDHFGGFSSLFQVLPPKVFWHSGQTTRHPQYRKLRKSLRAQAIPLRTFRRPQTFSFGEARVEVLHPFPGPHEGRTYYWARHANDNSLVLRIIYRDFRILFTGDIEERAEEILLERKLDLRADILKVPHHGSRTSSTLPFLKKVRPRDAIASLGRYNAFRFPHKRTRQHLKQQKIRFWRTDQHGMIRVTTHGHQYKIQTFLKKPFPYTPN
ncbi:MAG: ComEC/Rec2 family competence protein, partial [Myxococcota bacterium]